MIPASSSVAARLLDAARGGDENAFRELIDPHRASMHAQCYRMLGSLHDAEDALQDALLRAWRGLATFDAGRPLRPWLQKIATNACIDAIGRRRARVLPMELGAPSGAGAGPGRPLLEATWIDPYPDRPGGLGDGYDSPAARYEQRESIELAFIAALQHIPPRQRAVLIMRDVLGFSAREVAEALETTTASVNSALQRAHATVAQRLPERSQQVTLRSLGDVRLRSLVERYVAAWESRNVDSIVAILTEDVTFAMPPHPHWFRGREDVISFIVSTGTPRLRSQPTTANGQPAVGWYMLHPSRRAFLPTAIEVLALDGDRVKEITAFVRPDLFTAFGLPDELPVRSDG